mmetsp:Transcript_12393/g.22309  ORF Transcript_12393/g.22309 Transcript_12393/m.22309 type:complete len:209 (-) Transcript_12393:774-1400(-)
MALLRTPWIPHLHRLLPPQPAPFPHHPRQRTPKRPRYHPPPPLPVQLLRQGSHQPLPPQHQNRQLPLRLPHKPRLILRRIFQRPHLLTPHPLRPHLSLRQPVKQLPPQPRSQQPRRQNVRQAATLRRSATGSATSRVTLSSANMTAETVIVARRRLASPHAAIQVICWSLDRAARQFPPLPPLHHPVHQTPLPPVPPLRQSPQNSPSS